MRFPAALLVLLFATLALAGCTTPEPAAPAPTGRIDGAVLGPFLSPYGNHTVRLVELDRVDVTSDLGGFTFRNVPPGRYNLTAGDDTTHTVRREITVYRDDITRVILQLRPLHVPFPHVAYLQRHGDAELAMPGESCDACGWSTVLHERPDAVVVEAAWNSPSVGDVVLGGTLLIEVFDQAGRIVAELEGHSPRWAYLPANGLPDDLSALTLRVTFGDDFVPQKDFEMDSFLTIYHDITPEQLATA